MHWQPIETAPKDELILVARTKRMCGPCAAMNHSQDGWVTETPGEWVSIYTPSHWMPLPAAPDAVLEESKAMAASGDRVGALKHYRAGKGCSLEEARDALYPGESATDFPAGAIHNGRVHAERLEATGLECDAGSLQLCNDWVEFRRCFEHLAQWAEGQCAKESP